MDEKLGTLRVELGGHWSLFHLYDFSHAFSQVYCLTRYLERLAERGVKVEKRRDQHEEQLLGSYPWRGGYSASNFYRRVQSRIEKEERPTVLRIEYHSPGYLELGLVLSAGLSVAAMVGAIARNGSKITQFVNEIYRTLHDKELMRIEAKRKDLELKRDQLEFLRYASSQLESLIEMPNVELLDDLVPNDLARLKLELSIERRARRLAAAQQQGRALIELRAPEPAHEDEGEDSG